MRLFTELRFTISLYSSDIDDARTVQHRGTALYCIEYCTAYSTVLYYMQYSTVHEL